MNQPEQQTLHQFYQSQQSADIPGETDSAATHAEAIQSNSQPAAAKGASAPPTVTEHAYSQYYDYNPSEVTRHALPDGSHAQFSSDLQQQHHATFFASFLVDRHNFPDFHAINDGSSAEFQTHNSQSTCTPSQEQHELELQQQMQMQQQLPQQQQEQQQQQNFENSSLLNSNESVSNDSPSDSPQLSIAGLKKSHKDVEKRRREKISTGISVFTDCFLFAFFRF
ncbi:hypothetical protein HK100_010585 [Physocladia obscura]|uniref:Uncharacterized protein n=1 Tax=Physocladia obscura TaxID=109957 RepID=A0AAD5XI05_9FUNG|nr:hypothetical protein HK100_010585 [Physocladia obscura]